MTDLTKLSNADLLALSNQPDAGSIMPALIAQESGGRLGVTGPATPYGRAQGMTQMLPATAQATAGKIGVPWRPEMMTARTPEAAAYQQQLGQGYLQEGLDRTGNVDDALRFYHGGPDRKLWGPKTEAYVQQVKSRMGAAQPDLSGLSNEDLLAMAGEQAPGERTRGPQRSPGPRGYVPVGLPVSPKPPPGSTTLDVTKGLASGGGQGIRALADSLIPAGLGQEVVTGAMNLVGRGADALGKATGIKALSLAGRVMPAALDYQPKTVPGQYAQTFAAFAPAAVAAPEGLPAKLAALTLPAGMSETGGQLTKGTKFEAPARFVGALAGGALSPAASDALAIPFRPRILPKPDMKTAGAITTAIARDQMTPEQVIAAARRNPTAPAFHAGGDNLAGLAEVAAQSPGASQKIIPEAVRAHQGAVPDQIKADIGQGLGGKGDYFASLEKARDQRKALALPFRDKAFSTPLDPTKYAENVAPVIQRVPSKAIAFAAQIAKQDGFDPSEMGMVVKGATPDGLPIVEMGAERPSMQALHYIKKGLDQDLNQYRDGLGRLDLEGQPMAASTSKVRSDLGKAMRDTSPDYNTFMQTWGDESGHVDALRLGRDVFSSKPELGFEQLKTKVGAMNPAEREMYAKGVGEALIGQVRSAKGGVGTMRQLLRSEEYRDRVSLAFPSKQAYDGFVEAAAKRVQEQNRNNRIVGGSPTYGRQAAAADLEAQGGMHPYDLAAGTVDAFTNPAALAGKGLKTALKSLPRKDRSIIGNPQSNAALGQALTDPEAMAKLLSQLQLERARTTIRPLGPWTPSVGLLGPQAPRQ